MKENQFFQQGVRGCLISLVMILLATCAVAVSANYQYPENPSCAGMLGAGFPVLFICDDWGGGSPTGSWGKIDYVDVLNGGVKPGGFLADFLFYWVLVWVLWFIASTVIFRGTNRHGLWWSTLISLGFIAGLLCAILIFQPTELTIGDYHAPTPAFILPTATPLEKMPASVTPMPVIPTTTPLETKPPTMTPTQSPTILPSPTTVPPALILNDFPLAIGATWIYSSVVAYQNPDDFDLLLTWNGFITDTVIDENTTPDGRLVYTLQEDMAPIPPQGVWTQPGTYEYIVSGDGIFRGDIKIYQWPLPSDHVTWEAFPDSGYVMNVNIIGNVDTPYGELNGCYQFFLATHPDGTVDTFCPGIGFVEHFYQHRGTAQIEHFVLVSFIPGQ